MINFKQDTHIHTKYSPDADKTATFKEYIDKAKELGLKEIIFTDHVDFDPAHPLFKVPIDYDKYIKDFKIQTKNSQGVNVKLGVEIGYQTHVKKQIKTFLKTYPFQHVILSIHYLEKKDLYTKEYFLGKTKKEAYTIYFEKVLEAVNEIDDFSVIGHLDYIPRYSDFGDYEYTEYQTIIDQILLAIIHKNKGIEINTSGFNYEGRQYPKKEVVDRYIELGGKIITLGSDSHAVDQLTRNYDKVKKIM